MAASSLGPLLRVADIDGDPAGLLDLAILDPGRDRVEVIRQTAPRRFVPEAVLKTGSGPTDLLLDDLTGDGLPDLVVANHRASSITFFRNDGGSFVEAPGSPLPVQAGPFSLLLERGTSTCLPDTPPAVPSDTLRVFDAGSLRPLDLPVCNLFGLAPGADLAALEAVLPYHAADLLVGYRGAGRRDRLIKRIEDLPARLGPPAVIGALDEIEVLLVSGIPPAALEEAREAVGRMPGVEYTELDYIPDGSAAPNDPLYPCQWALGAIDAEGAWDLGAPGPPVVLAVLDSGVDSSRPDLDQLLRENVAESGGLPGVDDDANGVIDDARGADLVNGRWERFDVRGSPRFVWRPSRDQADDSVIRKGATVTEIRHGSAVSEILGARRDNGFGIAGLATVTIEAVKVLDRDLRGRTSGVAHGLVYAARRGAQVVNLSLGRNGPSPTLSRAAAYADSRQIVVVAAAGNADGMQVDHPAADRSVLGVGAANRAPAVCWFSNGGSGLDVVAPGVGVFSSGPTGYCSTSGTPPCQPHLPPACEILDETCGTGVLDPDCCREGTSFAAPHAAGLACLMKAMDPGVRADQVRAWIRAGALDLDPPGYDEESGFGLIQAVPALKRLLLCRGGDEAACEATPDKPPPGEAPLVRCWVAPEGIWCDGTGLVHAALDQ